MNGRILVFRWSVVAVAVLLPTICRCARAADAADAAEKADNAANIEAAAERRLAEAVEYLASDELQGRGVGTQGLQRAADYLAEQFAQLGLNTQHYEGTPFQSFQVTTDTVLGPKEENRLLLMGPPAGEAAQQIELQLGEDFNTLAIGGNGKREAPLVFAGYGITAKEHQYDDYAELDVRGKVVLILRKEPQQDNPDSVFAGNEPSRHALFRTKINNAVKHGAAAVILVNDQQELGRMRTADRKQWDKLVGDLAARCKDYQQQEGHEEPSAKLRQQITELADQIQTVGKRLAEGQYDQLLGVLDAGSGVGHPDFPVFFCRREAIDPVIQSALGVDLAELERKIDQGPAPQSQPLQGWQVSCQSQLQHKQAEVKNVVAVLEGEGPLADETIVVGAHYDHLGNGGPGSLAPWTRAIHNGADDNASGSAALLEVARTLAQRPQKLPRRVVFIAFTGEEKGLLGSSHYVKNPLVPLEKTVAMVNMDMVGRLKDNKLIVHGTGTAEGFEAMVEQLNEPYGLQLTKNPSGFGPSDHTSFYSRKIPVLHLFTGTHNDYHRPSDDFQKINVSGMRQIASLVADIVVQISQTEQAPKYLATRPARRGRRGPPRPYLGTVPDFSRQVQGYALMGVAPGSPAERAGMKAGDVIIQFGQREIDGLDAIDAALRKCKAGDAVKVIVLRDEEKIPLTVTLDPPR